MVETSLTPKLIEEGAALVQALDKAGVSPDAAFWFYSSDSQGWKLVLAEMRLGPEGPRKIYRQIQRTLSNLPQDDRAISLDDVAVAKPDAPIVAVLKRAVRTGSGVSGIRFTQNVVDGILIEDAYIYRLAKPAA